MQNIRKIVIPSSKIIPLKRDFMFSDVFNDPNNIDILEAFIASYFDLTLEEVKGKIKVKPRRLSLDNKIEANSEVDLYLEMNGEKVNIEISTKIDQGIIDRNIIFLSKIHSKSLEHGDGTYLNIRKTIQINLVDQNLNQDNLIETYYLRNSKGDILSKKFQIDYVDMTKAKEICYNEGSREERIREWCEILTTNDKETFHTKLKETKVMTKVSKEKLRNNVEKLSENEDYIIIETKLSKYEMEHNTFMEDAKKIHEEAEKMTREAKKLTREAKKKQKENEIMQKENEKAQKENEKAQKENEKVQKENEKVQKENQKVQKENEKKQEETTRLAKETLKLINDTLNGFSDDELKAKVIKLKEDGQRIIKELESK